MSLASAKQLVPRLGRSGLPWARVAVLLVAAQLASLAVPCPVDPVWKRIDAARALSAPPPCPGHSAGEHRAAPHALPFMVFRCPCGCGDAPPPATGVHYSRVAVLPPALEYTALAPAPQFASEPAVLAPQRDPSGIQHVPRAV
jgi:hypothetical protein